MEIHRISSFTEFVTEHFSPMTTHVEDAPLNRIILKQKSSPSQSIKIIKKTYHLINHYVKLREIFERGSMDGQPPNRIGKGCR